LTTDNIHIGSNSQHRLSGQIIANTYYFQSTDGSHGSQAIFNDGDYMTTLDVLAKEVGIRGIFSDWPGTVTYYANCMGLK
jgi:glycerophosphoryl diester phosphodiesterase